MEVTTGRGQGEWRIVAGKKKTEWRGRLIAVRRSFGQIIHKGLEDDAIAATIRTPGGKVGILYAHLPPKATLTEAGKHTALWASTQAMKQPNKILLGT